MASNVALKELETRGFVVMRGFLSADELDAFRRDYADQPDGDNQNYRVKNASRDANARLAARVSTVLGDVAAQTALRVDAPQGAAYFATGPGPGLNFDWHQDHESFFVLQNHYDYLNFYIPIVKPRPDKSNLSIVPFDVLQAASPRSWRALVYGGATRFVRLLGLRLVIFDDSGWIHRLRLDLDDIAHTPQLSAGDCLLLRGDVVHRTQDSETERVAMSFRAAAKTARVSRARLAGGSWEKAAMMAKNPRLYERMFRAFEVAGKSEMTIEELTATIMTSLTVDVDPGKQKERFTWYLLRQKLRTGMLPRFVLSVAATSGLQLAQRASAWYGRAAGRRA